MSQSIDDILNSVGNSLESPETDKVTKGGETSKDSEVRTEATTEKSPTHKYPNDRKSIAMQILELCDPQELPLVMQELETGKVPNFKEDGSREWTDEPDLAEEILMWFHETQDKTCYYDERSAYIMKVRETITDVADEKHQYFLETYAELVNYHPAFCQPIIDRSPAFFSSFEEMDIMHFAIQASILKELKIMNLNLEELTRKMK